MRALRFSHVLAFFLLSALVADASAQEAPSILYGRDVRPILSDRCFSCHGPDAGKRKAGLRLDLRESATMDRDGVAAVVPGDASGSELWRRITSHDDDERMPPPSAQKRPLRTNELELLRTWIDEGASYEDHWAFQAPVRPTPPPSEATPHPIDAFLAAELARRGLEPSPEAPPERRLRRLFLDLTGLPPTPEELADFLADPSEDRWERWVDKILSTEPYLSRHAERLAQPWLDQARYADTCGIHMDAGRQIWPWRDWVLEAFRDNMPFDRFLTEQIAGDLIEDGSTSQKVASGFLRNHVTTDEGGAINAEYLVEYGVDRTTTVGSVFLGLTLGCARCHDHKYDPITQEDFYSFYAFFNSNDEPGLYSQSRDPNRAHEPFLVVPTEQQEKIAKALRQELEKSRAELDREDPRDVEARERFFLELPARTGVEWVAASLREAKSENGATLSIQEDGSVLASGANPDTDTHDLVLDTERRGLRLLLVEALGDPSLANGRVGRASNGNAVLSGVTLEVVSKRNPSQSQDVRFTWAWADHEQPNGDYRAVNVLDADGGGGWAVEGHNREGGRVLMLLAEEEFGYDGGSELRISLRYRSVHPQHVLGRVRIGVARLAERGLDLLPVARSGWYRIGPFAHEDGGVVFDEVFGPEQAQDFASRGTYRVQEKDLSWRFEEKFTDGATQRLENGLLATYVATRVFAPSARRYELSLGSDDGFRLYVDGKEISQRRVSRGVAPDQDSATVGLEAGEHWLVLKIVNTGGAGGFYYREKDRENELSGLLVAALLPKPARPARVASALLEEWKVAFSARHRQARASVQSSEKDLTALEARFIRTMIMKELAEPRSTFVLDRGAYDKPDRNRPVSRAIPAALGAFPEGAPKNRLGVARWLVSESNPLTARVAVNRLWDLVFGQGIVRTTEDFGLQGEWPSHPELLDWLAVEMRESGWNVRHMLKLLVTSDAYKRSSELRPELLAVDPDGRLLGSFPRRRLSAEQLRDQALYFGGLLVERFGGPSVKPYQPDGLWKEVAMLQSNTRIFKRDDGDALWRRSLYTYWKRACPPPAMLAFDAPTREFCTIRRSTTNTPLQALVLWNDEQHVEAARSLAARVLRAPLETDEERLAHLWTTVTVRIPSAELVARLSESLLHFRDRYREDPSDARALSAVGESPTPEGLDPTELAAWTMIASACMNLDATLVRS